MPLRNAKPRTFAPAGLSDTLDEGLAFPGACSILQNLMCDPSSANMWIARPGAVQLTSFSGFTTPGVISCLTVIGNRAYGLIATGRNAGNTTTTALPSVPVAVATYMDRSWFAVNPAGTLSATYFTDTASLNLTAGTQIVTYGDNTPINALRGMPYSNVLGGIVQSLLVFKGTVTGVYNIYQVTGDASQVSTSQITISSTTNTTVLQSSLQVNSLNIATTTQAPNS